MRVAKDAKIYGNLGYDIAMRALNANAGFWTINSDGTDFQYNEVHHVPGGGTHSNGDGEAFDADYGNNDPIFHHNYSHDNAGGFLLLCGGCGGGTYTQGAIVSDNLSVNDHREILMADGSGQFHQDGSVSGPVRFLHNTIYLPPGSTSAITATQRAGYQTAVNFQNNIIANLGQGGYLAGNRNYLPSWSHNLFYGAAPSQDPSDSSEAFANPQFVGPLSNVRGQAPTGFAGGDYYDHYQVLGGYKIQPTSPAAARGLILDEPPDQEDLFQDQRPNGCPPDIGAHQVTPASTGCR